MTSNERKVWIHPFYDDPNDSDFRFSLTCDETMRMEGHFEKKCLQHLQTGDSIPLLSVTDLIISSRRLKAQRIPKFYFSLLSLKTK